MGGFLFIEICKVVVTVIVIGSVATWLITSVQRKFRGNENEDNSTEK